MVKKYLSLDSLDIVLFLVCLILAIVVVILRVELNAAQDTIVEYEQAKPAVVYHNEPFTQLLITDSGLFAVKMKCTVINQDQHVPSRADIPEGTVLVAEGNAQTDVVAMYLCERSL